MIFHVTDVIGVMLIIGLSALAVFVVIGLYESCSYKVVFPRWMDILLFGALTVAVIGMFVALILIVGLLASTIGG